MPRYTVRFFFEWLGPWLWAGDEITRETWGYSDLETKLLSEVLQKRGNELRGWHDTSLNWGYPLDPGPWRQEECDQFNQAVRAFFADIGAEMSEDFELLYQQADLIEDPDLDEYLKDPEHFKRKQES